MYKVFLIGLLVALLSPIHSQENFNGFSLMSSFVDCNGKVDGGYVDLDYSPIQPLMVPIDIGQSYSNGKIYLNNGEVLDGMVKYNNTGRKLLFKSKGQSLYDNAKRIKVKECAGFKIMTDTFTVISDFKVFQKKRSFSLSDKPSTMFFNGSVFAEVLGQTNGFKVYKLTDITNNGSKVSIYFLLEDKDGNIIDISKENNDWQSAIKPLIGNNNTIEEANEESYREFFKEKAVIDKIKRGQKVFYSKYLEELDTANHTLALEAEIKKDADNWHYLFRNINDQVLMIQNYKSLVPFKKNDISRYFYPNGSIRKTCVYKNEKLIVEGHFHINGALHYEIAQNPIEKKEDIVNWFNKVSQFGSIAYNNGESLKVYKQSGKLYDYKTDKEVVTDISKHMLSPKDDDELVTIYLNVCDSLGNQLLDAEGNGQEVYYDANRKCNTYRVYINHQLKSAYHIDKNNEKIYHYCDKPVMMNSFSSYRKRSHEELRKTILAKDWEAFPQGTFFLRYIIDENGKRIGFNIENVHDENLMRLLAEYWYKQSLGMSWKVARHDKKKVKSEIIIPVMIAVKGFSPLPSANSSMWMMQQQQQMQMMQMNTFQPPIGF